MGNVPSTAETFHGHRSVETYHRPGKPSTVGPVVGTEAEISVTTQEEQREEESAATTVEDVFITSTTEKPIQKSTKSSKTTQDPLDKLEALRKLKHGIVKSKPLVYQGDLLSGEEVDDSVSHASSDGPFYNFAKPFRNPRFRLKKFKTSSDKQKSTGPFGKRIRTRKKPAFWNGRFNKGLGAGLSVEPTVRPLGPLKVRTRLVSASKTSEDSDGLVKKEEYRRKLRPFFDQLYQGLTQGDGENNRRFGLPRRRSTTAVPPITVDAEIYEVHPKTRLRITTRKPTTTEKKVFTALPTTDNLVHESSTYEDGTDYYTYQDDYVYEPTTQAPEEAEGTTTPYEEVTTWLYEPTPAAVNFGLKADSTTTESEEITSTVEPSTTTTTQVISTTEAFTASTHVDSVHETADKHSTTTQIPEESIITESPEINEIEDGRVVKPVSEVELEILTLDIANEIADQAYEESQVVETTYKGKLYDEDHTEPNTRLTSYKKNIDTSHYSEDKKYNKDDLKGIINEHGKQHQEWKNVTKEGESSDLENYAGWQAYVQPLRPYYEINRQEGQKPIVSIEEIEIKETKDYSEPDILYDLTKDSFDNESDDSFSVPVSVALNVPDTTTIQITTPEPSTEPTQTTTTEPTLLVSTTTELVQPITTVITEEPTTVTEVPTTITTVTEKYYKHFNPTTYSRIYSLINRNKGPISTVTTTSNPNQEVFLGTTRRFSLDTTRRPFLDTTRRSSFDTTRLPLLDTTRRSSFDTTRRFSFDTTRRSSLDLSGAKTAAPASTTEFVDYTTEKTFETAHKIPVQLWSAYEISREGGETETTTAEEIETEPVPEPTLTHTENQDKESLVDTEHDEINTEGFNLASFMSYSMPAQNPNSTSLPTVIEIDELQKPNEHESEVLVIEEIPESATNNPAFHKLPKAIEVNHPVEEIQSTTDQEELRTFNAEQLIPLRQKDGKYTKKSETKTKKREEWIKSWVERKYNKPKFPRGPLLPLAHVTQSPQETIVQITTEQPQEDPFASTDSEQNEPQHSLLIPTIPPKIISDAPNLTKIGSVEPAVQSKQPNSRFNVNFDVTVRDGSNQETPLPELSDLKSSLLEKYSSSRYKAKNSLFHKGEVKNSPAYSSGAIRGADADLFRRYGGKSLSQSDFERQILGVSTATEISVKSMICVKGKCFNADEMGKLLSK